jgi:hypothetical protein
MGASMSFGGLLIAWLAGCSSVTVEGRVIDGLNGQPIAGPYRIKAKATKADAAISCQFLDAEVDADGKFKLEHLCTGTSYALDTDRDDVWFVDVSEIPDGGWGQPTDLTAWRVPKGNGLYKLSAGKLDALKTATDVSTQKIWKTDVDVRYPAKVPNEVVTIGPDDYLVMVGKNAVEELKFWPVISSGARRFGDESNAWDMEPWVYIGTKFTDDSTYETVTATLDASKVVDKAKDDRMARFVSGAALPAGRYAVLADDDKRLYMLDFGKAQGAPAPTATPGETPPPAVPHPAPSSARPEPRR